MKAAQIKAYGGPDVLKTVSDAPKPEVQEGQILVEVHAASVNPFDWKVREGNLQHAVPLKLPATLGGDMAGVVSEIGEKTTTSLKVGDEVYGQANALSGVGSFAEFTPVAASSLALKPNTLSFEEAAAAPLTSVSAHQALVDHIDLKSGQKILIIGGAGGIGSFAVQLAKHIGAYVVTTASAQDIDFIKGLGADEVIDYTVQDFSAVLKDYDAVFDTANQAEKSLSVLKAGGILVSMTGQVDEALAKEHAITSIGQQTKVTTERLTALAKLFDTGNIKVYIDKIFPLDQAGEALGYIQSGDHHGKVVIKVK